MLNKVFKNILECKMQRSVMSGALFLVVFLVSMPMANAQQSIEDKLNRLENDIQTLSRAVYRGDRPSSSYDQRTASNKQAGSSSLQADMEVRLSQLEIEIRSLTGKIEQQNFEIRQINEDVERKLSDLSMRVAELEAKQNYRMQQAREQNRPASLNNEKVILGAPPAPVRGTGTLLQKDVDVQYDKAPETSLSDIPVQQEGLLGTLEAKLDNEGAIVPSQAVTPTDVYEKAFSLLRDKEYQPAEKSFQDFLNRYPGHILAANAKYWLGETFYVRNDFERAARVFAESYQQYPKGPKGPDSLLKLAMSLAGMGANEDACVAFAQIKQQYSSGAGPILARAEQEMENRNCP